ncbi:MULTISPECIES: sucrose synthase [Pseudanabaena]|jgi:sucrose synthase|uniref:sucrose synthase n=1 Tax=Pseudanabaena TaxID=1152 RepID=UPI002479F715|nr:MULTISPECIES: sucrose synthase [Pseudanabaena]MEA5486828.1 sucrose synthase [Pseudanabaena sp. CCNP1317]WGS75038.1 sucrose synthase [Pseudanabaena galeata CCNP1313]
MHKLIQAILNSDERNTLEQLVTNLRDNGKRYFLRNEILQTFTELCQQLPQHTQAYHSSSLSQLINYIHELILDENLDNSLNENLKENSVWLVLRPWIGSQQVWKLTADLTKETQMDVHELLNLRDRLVNREQPHILNIDFNPFYEGSPRISDPRNMGQGLTFLSNYLCNKLTSDFPHWVEALFMSLHILEHDRMQLLINAHIKSGVELAKQVKLALKLLDRVDASLPYAKVHSDLQALGFEAGWGDTVGRTREMMELLHHLLEDPEPAILDTFVSRVPAIFSVVSISIHGWIGQESTLGLPETCSQAAYVLEQARSIEQQIHMNIQQSGLDLLGIRPQVIILTRLIPNCMETQSHLDWEKIEGTDNAWFLRVPFQKFNPAVTDHWISKSEIWPYLESFAVDAERELIAKLGGKPNLIIGHYSDGNLVATLLANRLNAIHCQIAHSLEKPKHLFSNLYWQDLDSQYHFSSQFTAELIGMNAADFIITSSYQEIMGTPESVGQYDSYQCFTMPNLYHVTNGIDLFSPRFNRVPPGVNEQIFFPYHQLENRDLEQRNRIQSLLFNQENRHVFGHLVQPNLRPILAVAKITTIKNLTGLVECFGRSSELQKECNLILVTDALEVGDVSDSDAKELAKLHTLIYQYNLHGNIRWLGMRLINSDMGEVYRAIADRQGIFIHFAKFESCGRTILEAMISGLPTFATEFGGCLEIIQDGINGLHINPLDLNGTAKKILQFLNQCKSDREYWTQISELAIQRIQEQYNWQDHTQKLLLLAKIYSFWDCIYSDNREARQHYLEALFYLLYKPRAEQILAEHMQR